MLNKFCQVLINRDKKLYRGSKTSPCSLWTGALSANVGGRVVAETDDHALRSFHTLHLLHPSISISPWAVSRRDGRVKAQLLVEVDPIASHSHYAHSNSPLCSTSIWLFSSPAPWQPSPSDLLPPIIIHITDMLRLWPFGLQGLAEWLFARWPHINPSL